MTALENIHTSAGRVRPAYLPQPGLNGTSRESTPNHHQKTSSPNRILKFAREEWKWLIGFAIPILIAGGIMSLPASTAQVRAVQAEAATSIALVKSDFGGEFRRVNGRIDDLKADFKSYADETRADIKELLKRTPAQTEFSASPRVASSGWTAQAR